MDTKGNKEKSYKSENNEDFVLPEKELGLTRKELEVIDLIGCGFSQKEIAYKLNMRQKTVDKHIENIKRKSNTNKNTELMGLYVAIKKRKKFDINLLRKYGLEIFFILINICPSDTAHL